MGLEDNLISVHDACGPLVDGLRDLLQSKERFRASGPPLGVGLKQYYRESQRASDDAARKPRQKISARLWLSHGAFALARSRSVEIPP